MDTNTHANAGAAVLARSLRDAGTKKQLAILVTPDVLQPSTVEELRVPAPMVKTSILHTNVGSTETV